MATTTNYGWTTPDDTALVKDGASAIRTLGSSVDTTTKALNPSTTLGDIEYRSSTANTNTRLGIGTTGQVLLVSGGVPAWGTPSSGGMTLLSTTTFANDTVSYTISSLSQDYKHLMIVGNALQSSHNGTDTLKFRLNGDTGSNYANASTTVSNGAASIDTIIETSFFSGTNIANMSQTADAAIRRGNFTLNIYNYTETNYKAIDYIGGSYNGGNAWVAVGRGLWNSTAAITSLTFASNNANFIKAGIVRIYGVS